LPLAVGLVFKIVKKMIAVFITENICFE